MSEQKTEQKTDEQRNLEALHCLRLQMERLRDEFAIAAMREILAHRQTVHIADFGTGAFEEVAVGSYQMADAMLTARAPGLGRMTEFDSDHAHDMYAPATAPTTGHEQRIREALEAGPTDGDWEAWGNGTSRYGVTGPSAAAASAASSAVRDCPITGGQPPVYVASSTKQVPALAFGDTKTEAQLNAAYIAACNPSAIRALLADLDAMRGALKSVQAAIYMDDAGQLRITRSFDESTIDAALKGASHD